MKVTRLQLLWAVLGATLPQPQSMSLARGGQRAVHCLPIVVILADLHWSLSLPSSKDPDFRGRNRGPKQNGSTLF